MITYCQADSVATDISLLKRSGSVRAIISRVLDILSTVCNTESLTTSLFPVLRLPTFSFYTTFRSLVVSSFNAVDIGLNFSFRSFCLVCVGRYQRSL